MSGKPCAPRGVKSSTLCCREVVCCCPLFGNDFGFPSNKSLCPHKVSTRCSYMMDMWRFTLYWSVSVSNDLISELLSIAGPCKSVDYLGAHLRIIPRRPQTHPNTLVIFTNRNAMAPFRVRSNLYCVLELWISSVAGGALLAIRSTPQDHGISLAIQ
jgi:hypothetical protein